MAALVFGLPLPRPASLPPVATRRQQGLLGCGSRGPGCDRALAACRVSALSSSSKPAVVICPGFLLGASQYTDMKANLQELGHPTEIVPITNFDWWPTLAGKSFTFYLERLRKVVEESHQAHGDVRIVGHSAGGWIARIYLGSVPYEGVVYGAAPLVGGLVTLGTPHLSQLSMHRISVGRHVEIIRAEQREGEPTEVPEAVKGSSLQFANFHYPDGSVPVPTTCVAGQSVLGRRWSGGSVWAQWIKDEGSPGGTFEEAAALSSYEANCGIGNVWGDGVTPVETAILPGARSVVLEGVKHNPGAEGWYGDMDAVKQWEVYLD